MTNLRATKKRLDNYEKLEEKRQRFTLNLTASENIASKYVRSAMASVFANKYSEGRPQKRYYGGHEVIDPMELDVEELARKVFKANGYHVNVQAYSGSPANFACYAGIIEYICRLKKAKTGKLPDFHGKWCQVPFSVKFFNLICGIFTKSGFGNYYEFTRFNLVRFHKIAGRVLAEFHQDPAFVFRPVLTFGFSMINLKHDKSINKRKIA